MVGHDPDRFGFSMPGAEYRSTRGIAAQHLRVPAGCPGLLAPRGEQREHLRARRIDVEMPTVGQRWRSHGRAAPDEWDEQQEPKKPGPLHVRISCYVGTNVPMHPWRVKNMR